MTRNSFLKLVRQYAALSKRFNVSYAQQVNALIEQRVARIMKDEPDAGVQGALVQATHDAAQREYFATESAKLDARAFQDNS